MSVFSLTRFLGSLRLPVPRPCSDCIQSWGLTSQLCLDVFTTMIPFSPFAHVSLLFVLGVLLSLSTGNPSYLWLEERFRDLALSLKHIRSLGSGSLGKCFTVCLSENRAPLPQYLKAGLSAPHTCSYPHHESICLNLQTSDTWTIPCTHGPVTVTTKGKETLGGYQGHLCWKLYS